MRLATIFVSTACALGLAKVGNGQNTLPCQQLAKRVLATATALEEPSVRVIRRIAPKTEFGRWTFIIAASQLRYQVTTSYITSKIYGDVNAAIHRKLPRSHICVVTKIELLQGEPLSTSTGQNPSRCEENVFATVNAGYNGLDTLNLAPDFSTIKGNHYMLVSKGYTPWEGDSPIFVTNVTLGSGCRLLSLSTYDDHG